MSNDRGGGGGGGGGGFNNHYSNGGGGGGHHNHHGGESAEMLVPGNKIGLVIGKGGETIKKMFDFFIEKKIYIYFCLEVKIFKINFFFL